MINPASAGSRASNEYSVGNQRLLGNFSAISTYYFNANFRLQNNDVRDANISTVGFLLYNDKEGKYLNRTRVYALYAWHSKITHKIFFSGGFSIGGMNYHVKGTPQSGGGSDIVPDGSIGIWFYNDNFHTGISAGQIFNNKIQPIEEISYLKTFVNITGSKRFMVSEQLIVIPNLNFRFNLKSSENKIDINTNAIIKNILFITTGIHNNKNITFGAGVNGLYFNRNNIDINVTYTVPTRSSNINTSHIEIGINFLR